MRTPAAQPWAERSAQPTAWTLLAHYLRPQLQRALILGALMLATVGLELSNPQILRAFIDSATQGSTMDRLVTIAIVFLVVALVTQIASVAETYVAENVGLTATNALRADLTLHCLRLDPDFFTTHSPGELIERVDGDVGLLANFFARFVIHVVGNCLLIIGLIALLVQIDWRVGAALAGVVLLGLLTMDRLHRVSVPRWAAARQASAEFFGFLEERLSGTEDIRASGATAYVMRGFYERSRRVIGKDLLAIVVGSIGIQSAGALLTIGGALSIAVGGYLYLSGTITLGSVYLIFAYTQVLTRPIEQITRQMQDLQVANAGLRRVRRLLGERGSLIDGSHELPSGGLSVDLEHVWFGYVAEDPVLRDLSLHLAAGQTLGVLGRTGIGKSTVARLLLRLYDPSIGVIRLGGRDLRTVALTSLRDRVGMVTQEIQLFHASVRDNLSLFDTRVSDARMLTVLAELGLDEWLARLPAGLDSRLAADGAGMSAGEAQLLAFARVFLREPGLVILDEASSRLDPATERRIEQAIDRLLEGRTGIVIAHRLATLERVEQVLILDRQGVAEWGRRADLAADPRSALSALLSTGGQDLLA
ncbi:MAG TPA: ABC transporter ATP-binding protein [Chloroflexota bacterium]|nr:ABC transporter ATP-binding protein [Chloroflexota bacterium]